jgi:tetratricopeptide (TPR) repeat protein
MNRLAPIALCALALAAVPSCKRDDRPRAPAQGPAMPPPPADLPPPPGGGGGAPIASQISALEQMVAREPNNPQLWTQLGNLYFDSRQPQKAIDAYAKVLAVQPNNPDVLTDQGVMYRELQNFDKAVTNFEKAQKADPKHVQSLFNLGVVYAYDLNLPDKAAAAWNKVIAVAPQSPQAENAKRALEDLKSRPAKLPAPPAAGKP